MNQAYTQLCYGQFTINIPIPLDKEGGGLQKKKWPLGPQFGLIIRRGVPGPLPWIRHWKIQRAHVTVRCFIPSLAIKRKSKWINCVRWTISFHGSCVNF